MLNWGLRAVSVDLHARFIPSGIYNAAFMGPDQAGYSLDNPARSSTNDVKSALYLDLAGHYPIVSGRSLQSGDLRGPRHLTNVDPLRVPGANGTGNNELFDPIGRTSVLGVRCTSRSKEP